MAARKNSGVSCEEAMAKLAEAALALPGAWEDHPWGETVFKAANKKIFLFSSIHQGAFRCTCKLPHTGEAALTMFGFCSPTGYGLGKSGWVTAMFPLGDRVPLPMLLEWIQESYAAVAGERNAAKARAQGEKPAKSSGKKSVNSSKKNIAKSAKDKSDKKTTKY